jgi:hypothetical protein
MTGFIDPRRIVVAIPDIGHDDCRLAEIEALGERVIAAVMDGCIDLRNDGWLRKPALDNDVTRQVAILVLIVADIDESAVAQSFQL